MSKAANYYKCPAIETGENESTEMNCADDYCKRNCNDGYQAMKPKKATCMKDQASTDSAGPLIHLMDADGPGLTVGRTPSVEACKGRCGRWN